MKKEQKQESTRLPESLRDRILEGLSPDQKKAVESAFKYIRVIAGAGAGKTETLTRRVAYLLLVEGAEPSSIVAFTFTDKAAASMKSRIYRYIAALGGPTNRLGEMYVGTIHSYAKRILDDHPKYGNYSLLDENREVAFLSNHSWDMFQGEGRIRRMGEFLSTFKMALDEMLDDRELEARAPEFHRLKKKYEDKLEGHRLLTFGMSIKLAVEALREKAPPGVKHLFVDEYQDINRAQEEMIKLIGREASVFVVGDPRQSIYQWRGSDERFFETFPQTFSPSDMAEIKENRRSAASIVRAANQFAKGFEVRHADMEEHRKESGLTGLREFADARSEARWVADQIEALIAGGLRRSDIGVMMRSVRNYAGPLITELKARKITHSIGGGIGLFRRDEVQAMARIFSWLTEGGSWPAQLNGRGAQLTGEELLTSGLALWASAVGGSSTGAGGRAIPSWERELRLIKGALYATTAARDAGNRHGYSNYTRLYHDILNALGFKSLDYRDENDAAVMANLGKFHVLLTDFEAESRRNGKRQSWGSSLRGLNWFMRTYAANAYEEQPAEEVRGVDAVKVMTVHQAKGLEWPVVFVIGASRDRFPLPVERWAQGRGRGWMDVPRDMFDAARYDGSLEEERRLFYVAMTRARDVLVLTGVTGADGRGRSEFVAAVDGCLERVGALKDAMDARGIALRAPERGEEMQTFAAGDLIRYSRCPHMYLLGKVWGYQPELDEAIGFGNGLHYCLKRAADAVKAGKDPVDAVREAVDACFFVPFADERAAETFRDSAREMLERFAGAHGGDLAKIEESEYRIEYPVENATVTGRVDVIMREGGVREVREYKTSDEVVTPEELAVQIRMYALGLEGVGKPVGRASAAYLKEGRVDRVGISGEELEGAKRLVGRCVRGIVGREFKPVEGELGAEDSNRKYPEKSCQRCDQRNICRLFVEK